MTTGHPRVRLLMLAVALTVLLQAQSLAEAQATSGTTAPTTADEEALSSSRAVLASLQALSAPGFDEPTLRSVANGAPRGSFLFAGQTVSILGSGDATKPRIALGPQGSGAVVLVKLTSIGGGVAAPQVDQEAAYALARVQGTRISICALYRRMPSDAALGRRMLAALAQLEPPIATFDPTFQPGPGAGADRYVLK